MKDLAQSGMTMVVVTHELSFAREVADSLVFMDAGLIVEQGNPRTLLTAPAERRTRDFLSKVTGPLVSEQEQRWLISTVHALDHTVRLVEATQESAKIEVTLDSPDERRAVKLYEEALRTAAEAAGPMARAAVSPSDAVAAVARPGDAVEVEGVERLGRCAQELADLRAEHRRRTLDSVASGATTASDAIAQVDAIRMLDQRAHHAWRATAHLAAAVA